MKLDLRPAYGKVYRNLNAVKGAWCCGEEFFITGASEVDISGGYCNRREVSKGDIVKITYGVFSQNTISICC